MHKIIPSLDYNYWLKRFDTQLNEPTNQNSIKAPMLLSKRKRKRYDKTSGTSVSELIDYAFIDVVILV